MPFIFAAVWFALGIAVALLFGAAARFGGAAEDSRSKPAHLSAPQNITLPPQPPARRCVVELLHDITQEG